MPTRAQRRLPCTTLFLVIGIVSTAQSSEPLRFRSLGLPTADKVEAGRKINELKLFEGRLYLGHGDWFQNTGPTDIIYYDIAEKEFHTEYIVAEEAIHQYRQYGHRLFVPGTDTTESSEFGNLYVYDALIWNKHRTIPRGLHVFDFAEHRGRWYVATGSYFGDSKKGPWVGVIYSSEDQAMSWQLEYSSESALGTVSRFTSLMPYKDYLFAAGYRDGPMPSNTPPQPGQPEGTKQFNRVGKLVVHDGAGWFPADIIPPTPFVQTIELMVCVDRLLLNVRSGRYGEQFQNEWLLFAYDGTSTRRVPLDCDQIVDALAKDDRLILLLEREGQYLLVESADLIRWKRYGLEPHVKLPLSVECDGQSFYLGLTDGTVLTAPVPAD